MAEGVSASESWNPDYLLFTDADVVHSPDSVRTLVSIAETGSLDLVSAMVRLRCESLAERLLVPAFVFSFSSCTHLMRSAGAGRGRRALREGAFCSVLRR